MKKAMIEKIEKAILESTSTLNCSVVNSLHDQVFATAAEIQGEHIGDMTEEEFDYLQDELLKIIFEDIDNVLKTKINYKKSYEFEFFRKFKGLPLLQGKGKKPDSHINNKSHLTAMSRDNISVPMNYLWNSGYLDPLYEDGRFLDYGCGRGYDAEFFIMDKYDPHYFPEKPKRKYDVITCTYVLNVLLKDQEEEVLSHIRRLLKKKGIAYVSVRRDIEKERWTSRGTHKRNVVLDLPIIKETSKYCIYKLSK